MNTRELNYRLNHRDIVFLHFLNAQKRSLNKSNLLTILLNSRS